jgi:hypothetical protein
LILELTKNLLGDNQHVIFKEEKNSGEEQKKIGNVSEILG